MGTFSTYYSFGHWVYVHKIIKINKHFLYFRTVLSMHAFISTSYKIIKKTYQYTQ